MSQIREVNKALNPNAYPGDLLEDLENGKLTLDTIDRQKLPADLRELSVSDLRAELDRRLLTRKGMRATILALAKERDGALEAAGLTPTSALASFDATVVDALMKQITNPPVGIRWPG